MDEEDILVGQDWEREITKAVHATDLVIVCLSGHSVTKKGYIQKEIGLALDVADEQPEGAIFVIPLILEDCEVPEENVLGEVGKGYKVAIETLNAGRVGIGAQMVGVGRGALDATVKYVKEREQFGKQIGDFQGVQFQLAQAKTELEASRLLVYNAARLMAAGN